MLVSSRATNVLLVIMIAIGIGIVAMLASVVRGGPLDPPGPPGSTASVRLPGTPISQPAGPGGFPIVISQPGNYYLTENIQAPADTNGIAIDADNVTIDLMGFTLRGAVTNPGGNGSAVIVDVVGGITPRKNLSVRNGVIDNWTFCSIAGAFFPLSVFEDLRISGGRCGIEMTTGSVVRRVSIQRVLNSSAGYGIWMISPASTDVRLGPVVEDTIISDIGGDGIITVDNAVIRDSVVMYANRFLGTSGGVVIQGKNVTLEGNVLRQNGVNDLSVASTTSDLTVVRNVICSHNEDFLAYSEFFNDGYLQVYGTHNEFDMYPDMNTGAVCAPP